MPDLALETAELAALLLESLVYGIFLLLFFVLLGIAFISTRGDHLPSRKYIVPIAVLMMTLSTARLVIDFLRALQAFVSDNPRNAPDKFFKQLSHPYAVLNWSLYAAQVILGDGVLVWRCYVLCNRKVWVVIPGAMIISFNTAVLVIISNYLTLAVGSKFIHLITPWMIASLVSTSALQFFYSAAIVLQMRRSFANATRNVTPVITAIVESCALYTVFSLALLAAYMCASDSDWVLMGIITPLVGVSFCLIIIQLHFHFRGGGGSQSCSAPQIKKRAHRDCTEDVTVIGSTMDAGIPMKKDMQTSSISSRF